MVSLTDEQVDFILHEISARGISLPDLQADLLDHMCTLIENEMSEDDDFSLFFYSILPRFFHDNLHEIEVETIQIIYLSKLTHMKKALNYVLASATFFLTMGSLFKIMHWPGAAFCFVISLPLILLAGIPLAVIAMYSHPIARWQKLLTTLISLIVVMFACGAVFKVQHWPYGTLLMFIAVVALCVVYVPLYFIYQRRLATDKWVVNIHTFLFLLAGIMLFLLFDLKVSLV